MRNLKLLAIDSSGLVASAAIATEDTLLAEYTVNYKKTHSQTLLPMIDEIVAMVELDLKELDAIAVTAGPGSFTGLRIGAATAKGLGLALQKPLVAVPTVEALAWNLYGTRAVICPLMDARRSQVYTGLFEASGQGVVTLTEQKAVSVEEIIEEVNALDREVIYLGDGVEAYKERLESLTRVPFSFAPPHLSKQRAGSLAACAVAYVREGRVVTAAEYEPIYLRLSQAERERAEKAAQK